MATIFIPDNEQFNPFDNIVHDYYINKIKIDNDNKNIILSYNNNQKLSLSASLSGFTNKNDVIDIINTKLSVVDSDFDPSQAQDGVFYFVKEN